MSRENGDLLPDDPTNLRQVQQSCWQIAESKGWHEGRNRPTIISLFHSECTEALEADRDPELSDCAYAEELADIIIRVLDHAQSEGFDMVEYIHAKSRINADRPHKHGGKKY